MERKFNFVVVNQRAQCFVSTAPNFNTNLCLDHNTCNALERIFAALDTYAEMLRLDPTNLVSDTPYNDLIFRTQVRISQKCIFTIFRFITDSYPIEQILFACSVTRLL